MKSPTTKLIISPSPHCSRHTHKAKTVTHYDEEVEEDKTGLVGYDSNSDSDDNNELPKNPPLTKCSKVSPSPSESTKSHHSITVTPPIKGNEKLKDLDKTMHYHLDNKKVRRSNKESDTKG